MFEGLKDKIRPPDPAPSVAKAAPTVRVRSEWEPRVAGFFAYGAILLALIYTFSASVLFYSNFKVEGHGSWVYVIGGIAVAMGDAAFLTIIIRNIARRKMYAAFVSGLLWVAVMIASMVAEAGLFAAVIDHQDRPAAAAEAKYKPAKDKVARLKRELDALEKRNDLGAPADLEAELEGALAQAAVNEQGEEIRANVRQVTRWPDGCQKGGYYARTYCPALLAKASKLSSAKRLDAIRGGMNADGTPRPGLLEQAEKELEALGPEPVASVPLFRLMSEATGDSEATWTLVMIFVLAGAVHMILTFGVWVANEALLEDPEARAARLAAIAAIKAESEAAISRAEHEGALARLTDDLNAELDRLRIEHEAERAKAIEEARADLAAQVDALKAENARQAAEGERLAAESAKALADAEARAVDAANQAAARPNYEKGLPPEVLDPITIEDKQKPEDLNNDATDPADPGEIRTGDGDLTGLDLNAGDPGDAGKPGDPDPDPASAGPKTEPDLGTGDETKTTSETEHAPAHSGACVDSGGGDGGDAGGAGRGVRGGDGPVLSDPEVANITNREPTPKIDLSRITHDEEQDKIDELYLR